jgi:hypothetical protein
MRVLYVVMTATGKELTKPSEYSQAKADFERIKKTCWHVYGCGVHMEKKIVE